jgi:hypothetical protein
VTHGNKTHDKNKLGRLARRHAERAILGLAAIVDDGAQSAEARMAAARALLDLAYGGPASLPQAEPATAARPRLVQVEWGATK